jgi:Tfp pilus assembly protein PilF
LSKDLTRQGYDEYLHGNFQNAKKYYEQALAIDPNNERTKALLKDAEDRIQK